MRNLLVEPKFAAAVDCFAAACRRSREHDTRARIALEAYGAHGPQISGVVRDHFPPHVKDELRYLARKVTELSDEAWRARPKYVRDSTMRTIGRLVAKRDGSGFYGPQG